jgi:hypothetical protein
LRDVKKASHPFEPTLLSRASRKRTASSSAASTATTSIINNSSNSFSSKIASCWKVESAASQQQMLHVRLECIVCK